MKKRALLLGILAIIAVITLTGCVPGDGTSTPDDPAGFFWAIWHGWIAPFSLVLGLFKENINLYEVNNSGWWYDLGFYMSVISSGFGGLSLSRKRNKKVVSKDMHSKKKR
jgi:hypothetical protein